jgi:predicted permease
MKSSVVINQVLVLFLVMLVGFFARKRKILTPVVSKGLTDLLLKIICPMAIYNSFRFTYSSSMLVSASQVLAFTIALNCFSILLGLALFNKYPVRTKQVLRFVTIFSNCGFIGYPILQIIYGKIGVFYGSIFNLGFNLFLWTVGVGIFTRRWDRSALKEAFTNPNMIAIFLGLITFIFSIELPSSINSVLEMLGGMNTQISMMLVGAVLAEVKPKEMFSGFPIYYGTLVRLLFMPICALIATSFLNLEPIVRGVCVLLTATPAASITTVFTEKYNGDSLLASRVTAFSTLCSMITLPFFMFLLSK